MKIFLVFLFLLIYRGSFAQKQYNVEFIDTIVSVLPDTVWSGMRKDFQKKGMSNEMVDKLIAQLKSQQLFQSYIRQVTTYMDHAVIRIDRATIEGTLNNAIPFDSLLLKGGYLYQEASTSSGFSSSPILNPAKIFKSTGNKKLILEYPCIEYLSTDNTCRIWVTSKLPPFINPGLVLKNIQEAVLAFELNNEVLVTKSVAVKIE